MLCFLCVGSTRYIYVDRGGGQCPRCKDVVTLVGNRYHTCRVAGMPFTCHYCHEAFYDKSSRREHLDQHIMNKDRFVCRYCFETYTDPSSRNRHELAHIKKKAFACVNCGKRFQRKDYCVLHQQSCMDKNNPL